jgi:hypothetical protein
MGDAIMSLPKGKSLKGHHDDTTKERYMQFSFAGPIRFLLAFPPGWSVWRKNKQCPAREVPGRAFTVGSIRGGGERQTIREAGPYIVVRRFLLGHLSEVSAEPIHYWNAATRRR